ncbi:unnamed protein product [Ilex paraguariensis]|uniref:Protein LURP-one-related 6 n=1 Tax=Ilex paraguariensis TaxID=185542 RepID=A0ABC8SPY6_9AQUA
MAAKASIMPIVGKIYCSSSNVVLGVRTRPRVANGGGLVVTDCSQKVVFRVEGCGTLGKKTELILRDGNGNALLLIRRKGGIVEALSIYKQWKSYTTDYEGSQKLVFSLKEPNSFIVQNNPIRITIEPMEQNKHSSYEIKGCFSEKDCSIVDSRGNIIAQVGMEEELKEVMASKDLYHVLVKPGIDQAFIFGVIAILDYIYDGSTRC